MFRENRLQHPLEPLKKVLGPFWGPRPPGYAYGFRWQQPGVYSFNFNENSARSPKKIPVFTVGQPD